MRQYCAIVMFSLAAVASARADFIVGSSVNGADPGWQSFPLVLNDYNDPERPFWDQASQDHADRNIGNYVNGTYTLPLPPNGSVSGPGIPLDWWGYAGLSNDQVDPVSNEDSNWYFSATPGRIGIEGALKAEIAGLETFNEIGWYDRSDPAGSEIFHTLVIGADGPVQSFAFTPSEDWGLYLRSFKGFTQASGSGNFYFTEGSRNRAIGGSNPGLLVNRQHFALFALSLEHGAEEYLVGAEDRSRNTTVEIGGDYNDVVFNIRTVVPEPSTMALLAAGAMVMFRRRLR